MSKVDWTYKQFVAANPHKTITSVDYIHAVSNQSVLPSDFYECLARLFWPSFVTVDGTVFIADIFVKSIYDEYLGRGYSPSEAQPWVNQVELTSILHEVDFGAAAQIADVIVNAWNSKLGMEFGMGQRLARVILEHDEGEVSVTIGEFARS